MKFYHITIWIFVFCPQIIKAQSNWSFGILVAGGVNGWYTNDKENSQIDRPDDKKGHRMGFAIKTGFIAKYHFTKKKSLSFEPCIAYGQSSYVDIIGLRTNLFTGEFFERNETNLYTVNSIQLPITFNYKLKEKRKGVFLEIGLNLLLNVNGADEFNSHVNSSTTQFEFTELEDLHFERKKNSFLRFMMSPLFGIGYALNDQIQISAQGAILPAQKYSTVDDDFVCFDLCSTSKPVFFNNYLFLNLKYFLTKKEIPK